MREIPDVVYSKCKGIANRPGLTRPSTRDEKFWCKAIKNFYVDATGGLHTRPGAVSMSAGNWHSLQSINGKLYGAFQTTVGIINPALNSIESIGVCSGSRRVRFCLADGQVLWSDGLYFDYGDRANDGNIFSELMPAVTSPVIYNSRLYGIYKDYIIFSEPSKYRFYDKTVDGIKLRTRPVMVIPSDDGLYVADQDTVYFLKGGDYRDFKTIQLDDQRVVPGSDAYRTGFTKGSQLGFQPAHMYPVHLKKVATWTSNKGVMIGFEGGEISNLTDENYVMQNASNGFGAILKLDDCWQYISLLT